MGEVSVNSVVLAVVEEAQEVPGRTSLQKLVYFANEAAHLGIHFQPYYFGPFSVEVASSADNLVAARMLSEEIETGIFVSHGKTKEFTRHRYELTPDGSKYLAWVKSKGLLDPQSFSVALDRLKKRTRLQPDALSKLAKIDFLLKELREDAPSPRSISSAAKQHEWTISPVEARRFLSELREITA
jgi:uncharacterized protein